MLGDVDAMPNLAVKDLEIAKSFYEGTLGLEIEHEDDEMFQVRSGGSSLNVYRSEFAGTNRATAITWAVDDIGRVVSELKIKGVGFEHYDMPGMTVEGDLHVAGDARIAWFKDPDGNILNLIREG